MDQSFDAALLALVIHHVDDRVAALRELHRVLRPGAPLVVSTHHPTADWLRLGVSYLTIEAIEETWSRGWRVRYWRLPLTAICSEFAQAGFLIERLVEPRPVHEMAERFPEEYEKPGAGAGVHQLPAREAFITARSNTSPPHPQVPVSSGSKVGLSSPGILDLGGSPGDGSPDHRPVQPRVEDRRAA